jgi:hypothetical protein
MIFGMDLATFALLHVLISLAGIVAGFIVLIELFVDRRPGGWTITFLGLTILTSVTGFFFPFAKLLPSHIVGIISLVLLSIALFALYRQRIRGIWRPIYIVTAMLSLYLNVVVLIIQAFLKIPALKSLAPTQIEPPFLIVQGATLALFLGVIVIAAIRFKPSFNAVHR